jgi:hypothetical protein
MKELAHCPPVLFLIFNRPDMTQRVFERIRQASPRQLFIAADGPLADHPGEVKLFADSRNVVEQVDWTCEVHTLFREQNLGCGIAVKSAIDWFFENEEAGIILEDDCLPDQSFFPYCAELLERYKYNDKVGFISGDQFIDTRDIQDIIYIEKYKLKIFNSFDNKFQHKRLMIIKSDFLNQEIK